MHKLSRVAILCCKSSSNPEVTQALPAQEALAEWAVKTESSGRSRWSEIAIELDPLLPESEYAWCLMPATERMTTMMMMMMMMYGKTRHANGRTGGGQ